MNFRYRILQFMTGRYGVDKLFYILFGISVSLSVVNLFIRSIVLQVVVYAVIIYAIFRMFSRNIYARRNENQKIQNLIDTLRRKTEYQKQRNADKCHVYKKCPQCKAVLKLPRRIGTHQTICPKCGKQFTVKVKK